MRYSNEYIETVRQVPITSYLHSIGIEPVKASGNELYYHSPLTGEKTPSFCVNPIKNCFSCHSSGKNGSVITLVELVEKAGFRSAVERLAALQTNENIPFSFSGQSDSTPTDQPAKTPGLTLLQELDLVNPNLKRYVSSRGIPFVVAKQYLREVWYKNRLNDNNYAVGFKTDKGSFAIRSKGNSSKGFKAFLGVSSITTIALEGSTTVNLFEGFFDFLSALTYYKQLRPSCTTIVLNSTENISQAYATLEKAQMINCYLDNDPAGRSTKIRLGKLRLPVKDRSAIYHDYKDFNEMIQHSPK